MLRPADNQDARFLRDLLRHAYHWRFNENPDLPVYRYAQNWGRPATPASSRSRDRTRRSRVVPAVPAAEPGFGFVDVATPELTVAVVPSRRGEGAGAALLEALLAARARTATRR